MIELLLTLALLVCFVSFVLWATLRARKDGENDAELDAMAETLDDLQKKEQVRRSADARSDAERDRLRKKWTQP